MMGNKEKILLSLVVFLVVLVIVFFGYALLRTQDEERANEASDTPTPTTPKLAPEADQTEPLVEYEERSAERVRDQVTNPQPLNTPDSVAKQNVVSQLNGSGVLYTSGNVRLEYISPADSFHGVILSRNISGAKEEVRSYFIQFGMSNEGVCNLSLIFYIERGLAEEISNEGFVFDPLLEEC